MSGASRVCGACGASSSPGAAACWLCESALGADSAAIARRPSMGRWALTSLAAGATALLACIELAQLDAMRAGIAVAVVAPVFAMLGVMAVRARGSRDPALPSGAWRGAVGLLSIGLGLLLVAVVVGIYSARFAP